MRHRFALILLAAFLGTLAGAQGQPGKTFDTYVIDVEGGEATLFVSPGGESLLVDTGWPGFDGRDADRIAAVAQRAGIKQSKAKVSAGALRIVAIDRQTPQQPA